MALFKRRKTVADIIGNLTSTVNALDDHAEASGEASDFHAAEAEHHAAQADQASKVANRLRELIM